MTFLDHKKEAVEYISKLVAELDALESGDVDKSVDVLNAIRIHCQYAIRVIETEEFS